MLFVKHMLNKTYMIHRCEITFKNLLIYFPLPWSCRCTGAFPSLQCMGFSFIAVHGLLTMVASPVMEHRL